MNAVSFLTEEGSLISQEELRPLVELCSDRETDHISVLRSVLDSRGWIVERDSRLAQTLRDPLTSLCARYIAMQS